MEHEQANPLDHPEVRLASGSGYLAAFVLEVAGVLAGVWLIQAHALSDLALMVALPVIGLAVLIAQLSLLFKLNFGRTQIWHTVSLMLTLPLVVITIALTVLMFITLMHRTMLGI